MRFIADAMLGKLARWLRILGYDTAYASDIADDELIGRARAEGRFILTRDTGLVKRLKSDEFLFIKENATMDQLSQAVSELGLDTNGPGFLARCVECNTELVEADKDAVRGLVPEYAYHTNREFSRCPGCGRVYWPGTHPGRILRRLGAVRMGRRKGAAPG